VTLPGDVEVRGILKDPISGGTGHKEARRSIIMPGGVDFNFLGIKQLNLFLGGGNCRRKNF
jgi:hypothetical protein